MRARGWFLRMDIIWWRRNDRPTSARDRLATSYEHLFMFSKKPTYFFNKEIALREHWWQDVWEIPITPRPPGIHTSTFPE